MNLNSVLNDFKLDFKEFHEDLIRIKEKINEKYHYDNKMIMIYKNKKKDEEKKDKIRIFGEKFVKNNKGKCKIFINNGPEEDLKEFYDGSSTNSNNKKIDFNLKWEFKVVIVEKSQIDDMSHMFNNCDNLYEIPNNGDYEGFNWNMKHIKNISSMFQFCDNLTSIPIVAKWNNTINLKKMNCVFHCCNSLEYIPGLGELKTINVDDMRSLFTQCSSLNNVNGIEKWNVQNVTTMEGMFNCCKKLVSLPKGIANWNTASLKTINGFCLGCENLIDFPDVSNWNTKSIRDISSMFSGCINLKKIPSIVKWDRSFIGKKSGVFRGSGINEVEIPEDLS